jgi:FkbM family methyltransferase
MSTQALSESLLNEAKINGSVPERLLKPRAVRAARVIRHIGIMPTAQLAYDRLISGQPERRRILNHPNLRHPIAVTSHDVAILDESLIQNANSLPEHLYDAINGKPILDVGANIGVTAALYASTYPESPILAVEPHPRNTALLKENSLAYEGQINVVEAALALTSGYAVLANPEKEQDRFNGSYRFSEVADRPPEGLTAATSITPSEVALYYKPKGRIGLMKVDIEGAEKPLFASPDIDCLLDLVDVLAIETHDKFVPGSYEAVAQAAHRNGLIEISSSPIPHIHFFESNK